MLLDEIIKAIASRETLPSVLNISEQTYKELLKDERLLPHPHFGSHEQPQSTILGVITKIEPELKEPFQLID